MWSFAKKAMKVSVLKLRRGLLAQWIQAFQAADDNGDSHWLACQATAPNNNLSDTSKELNSSNHTLERSASGAGPASPGAKAGGDQAFHQLLR